MKQNLVEIWVGLNHPITSAASCPIVPQMHLEKSQVGYESWVTFGKDLLKPKYSLRRRCLFVVLLSKPHNPERCFTCCGPFLAAASFGHLSIPWRPWCGRVVGVAERDFWQIEGPFLQNKIVCLWNEQPNDWKMSFLQRALCLWPRQTNSSGREGLSTLMRYTTIFNRPYLYTLYTYIYTYISIPPIPTQNV